MPDSNAALQWVLAAGVVLVIAAAIFILMRRRSPQKGIKVTVSEDRLKRAAESILGDASLTDEMDDAPASQLMNWAVGISRQIAVQTAAMQDDQAQAYLEDKLQNLRRVVRRVNKLVGSAASGAPDEMAETLQKLFEAASQVEGLQAQAPADLSAAAARLQTLPPEQALNEILTYIDKGNPHGEAS